MKHCLSTVSSSAVEYLNLLDRECTIRRPHWQPWAQSWHHDGSVSSLYSFGLRLIAPCLCHLLFIYSINLVRVCLPWNAKHLYTCISPSWGHFHSSFLTALLQGDSSLQGITSCWMKAHWFFYFCRNQDESLGLKMLSDRGVGIPCTGPRPQQNKQSMVSACHYFLYCSAWTLP